MHHVGSEVGIYRIMCCAYSLILKYNVNFYFVHIKFDPFRNIIYLDFGMLINRRQTTLLECTYTIFYSQYATIMSAISHIKIETIKEI